MTPPAPEWQFGWTHQENPHRLLSLALVNATDAIFLGESRMAMCMIFAVAHVPENMNR